MPRRLRWLPQAVADLARLRDFIHPHNSAAAKRVANCIRKAILKLADHPLIGINVADIDDEQLRDLFIPFGQAGYWLRYLVKDDDIVIVRIWHGRENRNT